MTKTLFIITLCLTILFQTNCSNQMSAQQNENLNSNNLVSPTPTVSNANSNFKMPVRLDNDKAKLEELDKQNEQFHQPPDEWKKVDFKNFKFPHIKLKNGEAEYHEKNPATGEEYAGGDYYSLDKFYYVDLIGDKKKEAIVFLWETSAGGSSDGGSLAPYFYAIQRGKAKLLGFLQVGSRSGGCFIKSFRVEKKKIYLEQFGKCKETTYFYADKEFICKYCVSGLTKSVYSFKNLTLIRESVEVIETESREINNYLPEITINE